MWGYTRKDPFIAFHLVCTFKMLNKTPSAFKKKSLLYRPMVFFTIVWLDGLLLAHFMLQYMQSRQDHPVAPNNGFCFSLFKTGKLYENFRLTLAFISQQ